MSNADALLTLIGELRQQIAQLEGSGRGRRFSHHDSGQRARAERHYDASAWNRLGMAVRHPVREQIKCWYRDRD